MTEATFTKLRTSAAFDVVGSVGGPQTEFISLSTTTCFHHAAPASAQYSKPSLKSRRNFGLESEGTNSEGERGALGSRSENGEEVSPSRLTLGSGRVFTAGSGAEPQPKTVLLYR